MKLSAQSDDKNFKLLEQEVLYASKRLDQELVAFESYKDQKILVSAMAKWITLARDFDEMKLSITLRRLKKESEVLERIALSNALCEEYKESKHAT